MNHLFPAKVTALLKNIQSMNSYLMLVEASKEVALPYPNPQERIILNVPALHKVIASEYGITNARIRLVMPQFQYDANNPLIEIYNMEGDKARMMPLTVSEMSVTLALALETQLFYLLSKDKGLAIPMV